MQQDLEPSRRFFLRGTISLGYTVHVFVLFTVPAGVYFHAHMGKPVVFSFRIFCDYFSGTSECPVTDQESLHKLGIKIALNFEDPKSYVNSLRFKFLDINDECQLSRFCFFSLVLALGLTQMVRLCQEKMLKEAPKSLARSEGMVYTVFKFLVIISSEYFSHPAWHLEPGLPVSGPPLLSGVQRPVLRAHYQRAQC